MANYYYERYSINYEWESSQNNSVDSTTIKTNQENIKDISMETNCYELRYSYQEYFYHDYEIVPDYTVGQFTSYKLQGTGQKMIDLTGSYEDEILLSDDWYAFGYHSPNNYISYPASDPSPEFYTYHTCSAFRDSTLGNFQNWDVENKQQELHTLQTQTIYKNKKQGSYVDTIVAPDGAYPDSGFSGSYYYVKTTKPTVTLNSIGSKTIDVLDTLNFSLSANIDGDSNIIYDVRDLPSGASFDTTSGDFSWTPSKDQGGVYSVTFLANSNSSTDSETINITVNSVYPVISDIKDKLVNENQSISFNVNTNDPDLDTINCYITSNQPTGSTFNFSGTSGSFEWTPTYMQSGTYTITFEAEANGYYDTEEVNITVNEIHKKPENLSPAQNFETENRKPIFQMTLPANHETDNLLYHARLRIADNSAVEAPYIDLESKDNQEGWEYYNNGIWETMPEEGVPAGTNIRIKPIPLLNFSFSYWEAATWEVGYGYGLYSNSKKINILISTSEPYVLSISGMTYNAYSLKATETSNGEIGSIDFTLNNVGGTTDNEINYGDIVILAINDELGNQEQFRGRIKRKNPSGSILQVKAPTGDGILSERIIEEDYAAQDIGLIAKNIIDVYCSPLTSININTSTGIIAPIKSTDKTPLKIFEKLRREYGIYYFVDADWDMNFYLPNEVQEYTATLKRGD